MGDRIFSYELPSIDHDTAKLITERADIFRVFFSIGFLFCGAFLWVLGVINLIKKHSRLASSLSGSYFLGLLAYNVGSIIKCSSFATAYIKMGTLQDEVYDSFCGYFGGESLNYIYVATCIFAIVGLMGLFLGGSLQRVVIGFGIGSSLAGLLNWFSVSFIIIICFNLSSSCIFGFLLRWLPNKLSLAVNWISSFSVILGCLIIIVSGFLISDHPIAYSGYCVLSSGCFVATIILFVIVSRSEIFLKSKKTDADTAFAI